jgi:hypothetical protein
LFTNGSRLSIALSHTRTHSSPSTSHSTQTGQAPSSRSSPPTSRPRTCGT